MMEDSTIRIGCTLLILVICLGLIYIPQMSTGTGTVTKIVDVLGGGSEGDGMYRFWMVKLDDRSGVTKVYYGGNNLAPGQTVTISDRIGGGYNLDLGGEYSGGSGGLFTPGAPKIEEQLKELPAEKVPGEPAATPRDPAEPDIRPPWRP